MPTQYDTWISAPNENHGPLMSVATWSLTGISAGFLLLRLSIRHSQRKLWIDDLVLGISWLLLLSQVIINQLTINLGFGKHSLDVNFNNLERIAYYGASALSVSIFAITLSKISFGVTLLRLTEDWTRGYVYFAIATLTTFVIPAAIAPWVQCKPLTKTFVDMIPGTCINKDTFIKYGRFQAVWASIIDISLALLPWKILWGLQMRQAERIGVCVAMSLGILAGAAGIIRARYIELLAKQDLSYDAYNSVIWSVTETAATVIATSMPVLRVFFHRAVISAIATYHNSSSRGKSRQTLSGAASTNAEVSLQRLYKRTTDTFGTCSQASLGGNHESSSKGYLDLDETMLSRNTGRVTAATVEPIPSTAEHIIL